MKPLVSTTVVVALAALLFAAPLQAESKKGKAEGPYLALAPFTVNLQGEEGPRMHFLQIKVQLMSTNEKALEAVNVHLPAVQDALLMLFSHRQAGEVRTPEGREVLRREALVAVNQILAKVTTGGGAEVAPKEEPKAAPEGEAKGEEPGHEASTPGGKDEGRGGLVEALYFTDFVIQ